MSYRIVVLPYWLDGEPVGDNPADGPFDDCIAEGAALADVEAVATRWSQSPIAYPLKIYAPRRADLRLAHLQCVLEEQHGFGEEAYQVFTQATSR